MHEATIALMRERLAPLNAETLDIIDNSAAHAGHKEAMARPSAGHFELLVVSESFEGLNLIKRHQKVYGLLGDLMKEAIHALTLDTKTPHERNA